ncbi:RXT2-like protein [Lipomyces japonicus]|uniref:RXT2-like protein n=1 Tax=Lipomyces japonicus TaxID=56871 RepID=UPI0034CD7C4A
MVDQQVLEDILRFKAALERSEDASDSDSSIGAAVSNRGQKLKRNARTVSEGRLDFAFGKGAQPEVVTYANKKRKVVWLKPGRFDNDLSEEENDADDEDGFDKDNDDDPYAGVDIEAILSPIGHPSELPSHPGISRAYTRTTLSTLARRALDLICTEQKQLVQVNRLLAAFLGDDTNFFLEKNLHLPEIYDRAETEPGTVESSRQNGEAKVNGKNGTNGTNGVKSIVDDVKNEDFEARSGMNDNNGLREAQDNHYEEQAVTRRMTRNQATNELEPFFALPKLDVDMDFGFSREVAEETRQLAQMASQRLEQYLRSLYNVRAGLLRADRFRGKVYKWCREVGGDMSDDEEQNKSTQN